MARSTPKHVVLVAGARPNFMKIAPVLWALENAGATVTLVHSGQHYDAAMSDVFFDELGIREPDVNLEVGSGTQASQTAAIMVSFEPLIEQLRPDIVAVVGDVNSTVACALVAAKAGVRVAHVEAGLRSRDWAMPEEVNRVVTDRLSDHLLAPSPDAVDNLRAEGYRDDQIALVGNVMVDTLLTNIERAVARPTLAELGLDAGQFGLVTLHRPSNVDDPDTLRRLLDALGLVAQRVPLVFPVHPRTHRTLQQADIPQGIELIEPAGYLDFIALQSESAVVLTDSGGVQEETTVLGTPCLTLRENTERPITVTEGTNTVVGTDPARIVEAAFAALDGSVAARRPALWDGHAGERIADVLLSEETWGPDRRPTSATVAHTDSA